MASSMLRSLCIVNNTLYLSKASIQTLMGFLKSKFDSKQLENSDKATITFLGTVVNGKYQGTFKIVGNEGCRIALPYLKELDKEETKIVFDSVSEDSFNSNILEVVYTLIQEPYCDGLIFKKELI
jgi:hypothetical protein